MYSWQNAVCGGIFFKVAQRVFKLVELNRQSSVMKRRREVTPALAVFLEFPLFRSAHLNDTSINLSFLRGFVPTYNANYRPGEAHRHIPIPQFSGFVRWMLEKRRRVFTERIASAISTCLFKQRLSLVDFMIAFLVICEVRPRSKPVEGSFTILQCKFGVRGQLNFLRYLIGV
ncbi:hypothetical protein P5673_001923 [Acropora cervicornis]|uniref:Uncharacterized protein n=1 Tax=Acropora cervicornis TaxID=6130 RepID=A0AAD9VFU6_ACRCE|nr:hypothetical protein P5673_001923 [Acropora cervicornis]